MTDTEFLRAFEAATLPRGEWTHAAHLRMAYLYLKSGDSWQSVLPHVRDRIQCFNLANGNRTGYHETITVAFLRVVRRRLDTAPTTTFDAFRAANPDLFVSFQAALSPYYAEATLLSPEARARFVEPDRAPLP